MTEDPLPWGVYLDEAGWEAADAELRYLLPLMPPEPQRLFFDALAHDQVGVARLIWEPGAGYRFDEPRGEYVAVTFDAHGTAYLFQLGGPGQWVLRAGWSVCEE